ncbi:hypothetical protein QBC35DRAFT_532426 [Podospora australis]|uniref:F-box domain-containing protein n=1 Tax=Podospora australis TaxID=1536484 RepID=A0AAN6WSN5_9PEZI|nr:hypothetical protein QBC35DRAFT_532426 [Podospora australis]
MHLHPPSYQDATRRPDWLEFVAPYVPIKDYARLCLVSRRFYGHFAPRLWNDPLTTAAAVTAAAAGHRVHIRDNNDLEWFYHFMHQMRYVRENTRLLVTSIDLRRFTPDTSGEFSLYSSKTPLSESLQSLPSTFPSLRCILLDGHSDADASDLIPSPDTRTGCDVLLVSTPHCQSKLPEVFYASQYLSTLIYLDVSYMTGSPTSLKQLLGRGAFGPAYFPDLRILKMKGLEVDDVTAALLFATFKDRLWSLDLSQNRLTDRMFDAMHNDAFPAGTLRGGHADAEGVLVCPAGHGSASFGTFCFVNESEWSVTFNHPERHLADAPVYSQDAYGASQQHTRARLDGRTRPQDDSEDAVKILFSGKTGSNPPNREHIHDLGICQGQHGITHLYLNDNSGITASAISRMIMSSPGQLEHVECSNMSLDMPESGRPGWLSPISTRLLGILGTTHIFRPVFSSNLQVLRIHHSLVTQLASVYSQNDSSAYLSTMENLWLAEAFLLPRAKLAYPHKEAAAFTPDTNPRLQSLTLTHIPRYSTGPLIDSLVSLLKLASMQERAIQDTRKMLITNHRGPAMVPGLRHIRLEFDHDPREHDLGDSDDDEDDLDAEQLVSLAAKGFSFFGEAGWASSASSPSALSKPSPPVTGLPRKSEHRQDEARNHDQSPPVSVRLNSNSTSSSNAYVNLSDTASNIAEPPVTDTVMYQGTWSGAEFTVPVWIGSSSAASISSAAVREYMRLLAKDKRLHTDVQPAMPCHIAAGVPEGKYIYGAAWRAILWPPDHKIRTPSKRELRTSMKDVIEAMKAYRVQTRERYEKIKRDAEGCREEVMLGEPHFYYTGRLEVVRS